MTLEALLSAPTVEPDYRGHRRPAAATLAAATVWLLLHYPSTWTRGRACIAGASPTRCSRGARWQTLGS